jgi:hypothetical protein
MNRARPVAANRLASRTASIERGEAERAALAELEQWRRRAIPDENTPLEADDLVTLLRDCVASLGLDAEIASEVSVNTIHYYRRKDIIDPPVGKTAAARYDLHHLWQVAGARLAGALGLVTLAEARDVIRGSRVDDALSFLAARVADARAREAVRATTTSIDETRRPLGSAAVAREIAPLNSLVANATVVALPGSAWCVIPASHAAHHSPDEARALGRALVEALTQHRSSRD